MYVRVYPLVGSWVAGLGHDHGIGVGHRGVSSYQEIYMYMYSLGVKGASDYS